MCSGAEKLAGVPKQAPIMYLTVQVHMLDKLELGVSYGDTGGHLSVHESTAQYIPRVER